MQHTFSYLSLPPEIRNQIMRLAFDFGEVVVRRRPRTTSKPLPGGVFSGKLVKVTSSQEPGHLTATGDKHPAAAKCVDGYPFLSTCRQVFEEGRSLFFANTFRLPPGPVEDSKAWLSAIQTINCSMITYLSLSFGLGDITHEEIEVYKLEKPMEYLPMEERPYRKITKHLEQLWSKKLEFLAKWGQIVRIDNSGESYTLRTDDDERHFGSFLSTLKDNNDARIFVRLAASHLRQDLEQKYETCEWQEADWYGKLADEPPCTIFARRW